MADAILAAWAEGSFSPRPGGCGGGNARGSVGVGDAYDDAEDCWRCCLRQTTLPCLLCNDNHSAAIMVVLERESQMAASGCHLG
jgi:hypothetical protein